MEERTTKNPNEYWVGTRRYVREIRRCVIPEMVGDAFRCRCRLHERGENRYLFTPGEERLVKDDPSGKEFWLGEKAKETLLSEAGRAAAFVREAKEHFFKTQTPDGGITLYWRRAGKEQLDALLVFSAAGEAPLSQILRGAEIYGLLWRLRHPAFDLRREWEASIKCFETDREETLVLNPLYRSAQEAGDLLLQKQIRIFYRLDSAEDVPDAEAALGLRVLPALPAGFDRMYVVDAAEADIGLLARSGYTFIHRPNFAMRGHTREKRQLNPHTKTGVDAAKAEDAAIRFEDFLKLFEKDGA